MRRLVPSLLILAAMGSAGAALAPPAVDGSRSAPSIQECLAIVVHKSNPITALSSADLRRIFMGEQTRWPGGHGITLVMREEGQPERAAVLRQIYKMNEADLSRYLLHASFTGDLRFEPKVLNSAAGARRFVFNVPSAIGYLRGDETDQTIKILRIDGRLPGEDGYRLLVSRR